jgi:hypothetical protein
MQTRALANGEFGAPNQSPQQLVIRFEWNMRRNISEFASEPHTIHLFQRDVLADPTQRFLFDRSVRLPPLTSRDWLYLAQETGLGMNVEAAAAKASRFDWPDASASPWINRADLPVMHEGVAFHELQQMGLDVRANDAVRLDYRTSFRIDVVPGTAKLCMQPAAQRSQQVGETLPHGVRASHAFAFPKQFVRQIGAPPLFARSGIPARSFNDHFVHV